MLQNFLENLTSAQISIIKARGQLGSLNWIEKIQLSLAEKLVKKVIDSNIPEGAGKRLVWFSPKGQVTLLRKI